MLLLCFVLQIDLLLSPSLLFSYISPEQLPPALDGTFQYNHDDWIRFHMVRAFILLHVVVLLNLSMGERKMVLSAVDYRSR